MGKLINKLAHACGLYTADDVQHIEKHWRNRLYEATSIPIKIKMGAGGAGGHGHGPIPGERDYREFWKIPSGVATVGGASPSPTKPSYNLPTPERQRMTGAERRELAAEAARWCEQQRIETSPENIIFYLDDEKHLIRHG